MHATNCKRNESHDKCYECENENNAISSQSPAIASSFSVRVSWQRMRSCTTLALAVEL